MKVLQAANAPMTYYLKTACYQNYTKYGNRTKIKLTRLSRRKAERMGEIAEMILDGTLCQECGQIMDDMITEGDETIEPPGYPRTCDECKGDK
jgi:hypothetical protein